MNTDTIRGSLLDNNLRPYSEDLGVSFYPNIWFYILIICLILFTLVILLRRTRK